MQTSAIPAHLLPATLPDCRYKMQCLGHDGLKLVCSGSKQSSSASAPRSALVLSHLHISASSNKRSNILLSRELTIAIAAQRCPCIAVQGTQRRVMGVSLSRQGGGAPQRWLTGAPGWRWSRQLRVRKAAAAGCCTTPRRFPPPFPEACEHSTAQSFKSQQGCTHGSGKHFSLETSDFSLGVLLCLQQQGRHPVAIYNTVRPLSCGVRSATDNRHAGIIQSTSVHTCSSVAAPHTGAAGLTGPGQLCTPAPPR